MLLSVGPRMTSYVQALVSRLERAVTATEAKMEITHVSVVTDRPYNVHFHQGEYLLHKLWI